MFMSSMGPMAQATTFLTRHGLAAMTSLNPKQATTPPTEVLPQVTRTFYPMPQFQGDVEGYTFQDGDKGRGYYRVQAQPFHPSPFFQGAARGYVFTTGQWGTGYYLDRRYTSQ